MPEPIRVHVEFRDDAECVYAALSSFRAELRERGSGWIVDVYPSGRRDVAIVDLLTAVQECVDEHQLDEVRVEIDNRSYTMRGLTLLAATAETT